ncbi:BQ5605_C001g00042 [Microbotryum silenes-dioicae]|uniref:ASTRA-associated protein 1 n=1 Tax=Microbotryum silenes-dioicae TaxID=796604 RepID=A0A2X0MPI7_9BASI|nr:BQ5605_C001g00042 [Microbotryum silenes-dioicae]
MSSLIASTSKAIDYSVPPSPVYILRGHTAQISCVNFSHDGTALFSGDVEGWVITWNLSSFRPRLVWKPHEAGILTIEEFDDGLLTHGRDNKIHHFQLPKSLRSITRSAASAVPSVKDPTPLHPDWSMDVNAMAYCQMSLLRIASEEADGGKGKGKERALVAVPALTKDEQVDIFHLPTLSRVHRSIGEGCFIGSKTGTVMAIELFTNPTSPSQLHLLAAYEDGRIALFSYTSSPSSAVSPPTNYRSESEGWGLKWISKGHREAVMSMALSPDKKEAWSIGADHYLCRYRLWEEEEDKRLDRFEMTGPGKSAVGVRDDGRIIAVSGWDGEVQICSTKSGKPLAVLTYHRTSLQTLAFAPTRQSAERDAESDNESDDEEDRGNGQQRAWLATGGKDERISLWDIYPPHSLPAMTSSLGTQ